MEHIETCAQCGMEPVVHGVRHASRVVAESVQMRLVLQRAALFAKADAPVVITGESGTGKEVVARLLHANSERRKQPFVAVNVGAIPAELLESELFGHVRGAFTGATSEKAGLFEEAHGGTLFLDEIAEMPMPLQVKLLRVLQDGDVRRVGSTKSFGVDARIVCATHRDLRDRIERGLFREDLYYRLKVLTLEVPPLRDRREDILPIATRLLVEERAGDRRISRAAREALERYHWPGNVRELSNAVKHGIALSTTIIDVEHLPHEVVHPVSRKADGGGMRSLAEVE